MISCLTKYLERLQTINLNQVIGFLREIFSYRVKADQSVYKKLFDWLGTENKKDRSNIAHIIGHIAKTNHDQKALDELVKVYRKEDDPLAKRSLAISCGNAGRLDILRSYISEYLPQDPHRRTNLSYHLEYYGNLQQTILAIFNHICSDNYSYLLDIDLFTLKQIMDCEPPISGKDTKLALILKSLISDFNAEETVNVIRKNGVREFTKTLSSIMKLKDVF